jgi:CHAT domain-containing protein
VLALGNPELSSAAMALPYAEQEVRDIQRYYERAQILTGPLASEANFKKNAGKFDIIHVASHGEFDPHAPLLSCLRLTAGDGEDGRLETREISNLDLDAYPITLSACNMALGKMSSGDELMGLTRAFIYAGTPTIPGTFWIVNDASTRVLMRIFYSNLLRMDKFAAMQRAQLDMIRDERFNHPYYWACFQIIGDLH